VTVIWHKHLLDFYITEDPSLGIMDEEKIVKMFEVRMITMLVRYSCLSGVSSTGLAI
jgi:hypothetical protein